MPTGPVLRLGKQRGRCEDFLDRHNFSVHQLHGEITAVTNHMPCSHNQAILGNNEAGSQSMLRTCAIGGANKDQRRLCSCGQRFVRQNFRSRFASRGFCF
jgi:hypothetical protein